tara:strand:+ start:2240 stop:2653 length:414 start_codon:yes stop_codon:yes gene_type:complete
MKNDFLKHWRVVRFYIKKKYDIGQPDLDVLLFLYSEGRFTRKIFNDYCQIVSWDRKRFKRLVDSGWIVTWRKSHGRSFSIYELSHKAKTMISRTYRILLGEEPIPDSVKRNPLLRNDAKYLDKVHKNIIKDMRKGRW